MATILSSGKYNVIRSMLSSDSPKIIKSGVQELLAAYENNFRLSRWAKQMKADLYAWIYRILDHSDYDLRKWLYHMLCLHKGQETNMREIIIHCFENIKSGKEDNVENISWISALTATHCTDENDFLEIISKYSLSDYLDMSQIYLSAYVYRENPMFTVTKKDINRIMGHPEDTLSPIWLIKLYANKTLVSFKSYTDFHNAAKHIDLSCICDLVAHPDETIQKYAMWALAQERDLCISDIASYIPPEEIDSMEPYLQKWYYARLFQDSSYISYAQDHIKAIFEKIQMLPDTVREGIIIGIKKADYNPIIAEYMITWEEDLESNENILLQIIDYFILHIKKNQDFSAIIEFLCNRTDLLTEYPNIMRRIDSYKAEKEAADMAKKTIINYGTYNERVNRIGEINSYATSSNDAMNEAIVALRESVQALSTGEKEATLAHILDVIHFDITQSDEASLQGIEDKVNRLFDLTKKEKQKSGVKYRVLDCISLLANIATIAPTLPHVAQFVSKLIGDISALL